MGNRSANNIGKYNEEFKFNKNAFDDVIGDPFAVPEPVQGNLDRMKKRSSILVANNDFDSGHATRNTAQPSHTDFFCDVDHMISLAFDGDKKEIARFEATYITEDSETLYTPKERQVLEQTLGKLFRRNGISPVSKYFLTIRQSIGEKRQHGKPRKQFTL
jgi:hypothetical protein